MANSPSARKRIRQSLRRTERNVARRSRARRFVRHFEEATANRGSKEAKDSGSASLSLEGHFRSAMAELHRAAQKGALHRKAAARKVSRLAKRLKAAVLTDGTPSATDAEKGKGKGKAKGKNTSKSTGKSAKKSVGKGSSSKRAPARA